MPLKKTFKFVKYVVGFISLFSLLCFAASFLPNPWSVLAMGAVYASFVFLALWGLDMTVGYNLLSHARTHLSNEQTEKGWISLTFDDGPLEPYTNQILDVLKKENVKVTFFCLGQQVENHPEIAKRIVSEGHTVGAHSYSHRLYPFMSTQAIQEDIQKTKKVFEKACGVTPKFFRTPRGYKTRRIQRLVEEAGLQLTGFRYPMWDIENPPPQELIERADRKIKAGDIVLLHDGHCFSERGDPSSLVQALPTIIRGLRSKGLTPVKLDEAFEKEKLSSAA